MAKSRNLLSRPDLVAAAGCLAAVLAIDCSSYNTKPFSPLVIKLTS